MSNCDDAGFDVVIRHGACAAAIGSVHLSLFLQRKQETDKGGADVNATPNAQANAQANAYPNARANAYLNASVHATTNKRSRKRLPKCGPKRGAGVTIPSQKRYVEYFARNLNTSRHLLSLRLLQIRLQAPPRSACSMIVEVSKNVCVCVCVRACVRGCVCVSVCECVCVIYVYAYSIVYA